MFLTLSGEISDNILSDYKGIIILLFVKVRVQRCQHNDYMTIIDICISNAIFNVKKGADLIRGCMREVNAVIAQSH